MVHLVTALSEKNIHRDIHVKTTKLCLFSWFIFLTDGGRFYFHLASSGTKISLSGPVSEELKWLDITSLMAMANR